jgi:transposase
VTQRAQVVAQMTRAKNRIHGVLHAHLIPPYRGELFSAAGRLWLEAQPLSQDEKLAIRRHLADLDHRAADLAALDQALAGRALEDDRVRRLMTIAGVHVTVALGLLAAIGDIARFASSGKLVSYLGLNPSVRQSGEGRGRPSTAGSAGRAGHMRVPCWSRPLGRRRELLARYAHSSCASRPGAASRSRRSPPRASWPSSPGAC